MKTAERLAWDKLRETEPYKKLIKTKLKDQKERCFYCKNLLYEEQELTYINRFDWDDNPMPPVLERFYNYVVDHRFPLSAGGNNSSKNLVICCVSCNSKKGQKLNWSYRG